MNANPLGMAAEGQLLIGLFGIGLHTFRPQLEGLRERLIGYQQRIRNRRRMTGEWLAHCQARPIPEIASVFACAGIPFRVVTGYV